MGPVSGSAMAGDYYAYDGMGPNLEAAHSSRNVAQYDRYSYDGRSEPVAGSDFLCRADGPAVAADAYAFDGYIMQGIEGETCVTGSIQGLNEPVSTASAFQACPGCGHEGDKKPGKDGDDVKTTYTCPMHPEVESDEPGKCPKCGMNLEPKKEHDHEGDKEKQQAKIDALTNHA